MKKILLPAFFIFTVSFVNAQTTSCTVGLTATSAYDNFSILAPPSTNAGSGSGLYEWGEDSLAGDANPEFKAVVKRNITTGTLDATITQGQDKYAPFGIAFGDDNGAVAGGKPFFIDMSTDKTFSVIVTNKSTTETIIFRMTVQDTLGHEIDTYAAGAADLTKIYNYTIEKPIGAGATVTLGGTYEGGGKAGYCCNGDNTANTFASTFDFTKVKGMYFTVTNSANTGAPSYFRLALTNVPISIDAVRLGGSCVIPAGISDVVGYTNANLYPNPTSDVANVTLDLKQVSDVKISLSNIFGKQVKVVTDGRFSSVNEQINVSDLAKGVYTVNYMVNSATVQTKLLLVK